MALVRREMWRSVVAPLTRPLINLHSAIPVLSVMNFHHGLLGESLSRPLRLSAWIVSIQSNRVANHPPTAFLSIDFPRMLQNQLNCNEL